MWQVIKPDFFSPLLQERDFDLHKSVGCGMPSTKISMNHTQYWFISFTTYS